MGGVAKETLLEWADIALDYLTYTSVIASESFPDWYKQTYFWIFISAITVSVLVCLFRFWLVTCKMRSLYEKELELYALMLACLLFIFEDCPFLVLNAYLLSQIRDFDSW